MITGWTGYQSKARATSVYQFRLWEGIRDDDT